MSLFLHTLYVVGILHASCTDKYWVLHYINILIVWFVPSRELIQSSSHMQLVISWIILWTVCFSDCDNVRFNTSSYAALHRGRPPERPFNCKKPPHLGTPGLTQYSSVVCLNKKMKWICWTLVHVLGMELLGSAFSNASPHQPCMLYVCWQVSCKWLSFPIVQILSGYCCRITVWCAAMT